MAPLRICNMKVMQWISSINTIVNVFADRHKPCGKICFSFPGQMSIWPEDSNDTSDNRYINLSILFPSVTAKPNHLFSSIITPRNPIHTSIRFLDTHITIKIPKFSQIARYRCSILVYISLWAYVRSSGSLYAPTSTPASTAAPTPTPTGMSTTITATLVIVPSAFSLCIS